MFCFFYSVVFVSTGPIQLRIDGFKNVPNNNCCCCLFLCFRYTNGSLENVNNGEKRPQTNGKPMNNCVAQLRENILHSPVSIIDFNEFIFQKFNSMKMDLNHNDHCVYDLNFFFRIPKRSINKISLTWPAKCANDKSIRLAFSMSKINHWQTKKKKKNEWKIMCKPKNKINHIHKM